jgi:hypothetical protein
MRDSSEQSSPCRGGHEENRIRETSERVAKAVREENIFTIHDAPGFWHIST